jgi:hypothetical protein
MSAKGKITTIHLTRGKAIMVTPNQSNSGLAQPARAKKKDAIAMTVYDVREVLVGSGAGWRRAYDVYGITKAGDRLQVPACAGNQTFWLATIGKES